MFFEIICVHKNSEKPKYYIAYNIICKHAHDMFIWAVFNIICMRYLYCSKSVHIDTAETQREL